MKKASSSNKISRYLAEDRQFWQTHLSASIASGMTRRAYCQKHSINYARFGYWKNRLENSTNQDKPTQPNAMRPNASSSVLLPVQIKSAVQPGLPQGDVAILGSLSLKNGSVLQIHDVRLLHIILERFA
jgi:hypothetical protein